MTIFAELSRTLESMSDILRESLDPEKSTGLPREQAEPWLPLVALLHGRALELMPCGRPSLSRMSRTSHPGRAG